MPLLGRLHARLSRAEPRRKPDRSGRIVVLEQLHADHHHGGNRDLQELLRAPPRRQMGRGCSGDTGLPGSPHRHQQRTQLGRRLLVRAGGWLPVRLLGPLEYDREHHRHRRRTATTDNHHRLREPHHGYRGDAWWNREPERRGHRILLRIRHQPTYTETTTPTGAGAGAGNVAASAPISGLSAATTYHFRLVAESAAGTTEGADKTFTTSGPPLATTSAATPIGNTTSDTAGERQPPRPRNELFLQMGRNGLLRRRNKRRVGGLRDLQHPGLGAADRPLARNHLPLPARGQQQLRRSDRLGSDIHHRQPRTPKIPRRRSKPNPPTRPAARRPHSPMSRTRPARPSSARWTANPSPHARRPGRPTPASAKARTPSRSAPSIRASTKTNRPPATRSAWFYRSPRRR